MIDEDLNLEEIEPSHKLGKVGEVTVGLQKYCLFYRIKEDLRRVHKYGGRCYERLKPKSGGYKSLTQD